MLYLDYNTDNSPIKAYIEIIYMKMLKLVYMVLSIDKKIKICYDKFAQSARGPNKWQERIHIDDTDSARF
jgi:hypothetical protein